MKWFQHQADCRLNKKWRRLEILTGKDGFFEAYGRVWRLWEMLAHAEEDSPGEFALPGDYGLDILAEDLHFCKRADLDAFLQQLAEVGLIDFGAWKDGIISAPKLADRADIYTKRKMKKFKQCLNNVQPEFEQGHTLSIYNTIQNKETPKGVSKGEGPSDDGPSLPSHKKISDPIIYVGTYFDLRKSIYDRLRKRAALLTDEQFDNLLEALEIYAAEHREKYDRYTDGKLKNPGRILHKWLEREVVRRSAAAAPKTPKPPDKVPTMRERADPGCGACGGSGFAPGNRPGFERPCDCVKKKLGPINADGRGG